jgi:hypothetical protein
VDYPAEWYLDRKAGGVTYMQLQEDLTREEVIAPVANSVIADPLFVNPSNFDRHLDGRPARHGRPGR